MKYSFILSLLFVSILGNLNAQLITCTQTMHIEYHPEYELWDDWPDEWHTLSEEEKFSMLITEEVRGKVYKVVVYNNGEESATFSVHYDGELSAKIRDEWNDPYVNCYYDDNGDYIYAQNVSLEQLSEDSSPWEDHDSRIYFWILSENYAIALR